MDFQPTSDAVEAAAEAVETCAKYPGRGYGPVAEAVIAAFVEATGFELWWAIQDRDDPDDVCRWGTDLQDLAHIHAKPEFADLPVLWQIRSPWRKRD